MNILVINCAIYCIDKHFQEVLHLLSSSGIDEISLVLEMIFLL